MARNKGDYFKKYGNRLSTNAVTTKEPSINKPVSERRKGDYFRAYGNKIHPEDDFTMQAANEFKTLVGGQTPVRSAQQEEMLKLIRNSAPTYKSEYLTVPTNTTQGADDYKTMVEKGKENQTTFTDNKILQEYMRNQTGTEYLDYANDAEKNEYFYQVGKNGTEEGKRYLKEIEETLKQRQLEATRRKATEAAAEHPLIGTAFNAAMPIISGLGYMEDAGAKFQGKELNPYSTGHMASAVEQGTREGVKEAARENFRHDGVSDFFVDAGLSTAQTLARLPFGKAASVLAGMSAATQAEEDALARGATSEQALKYGAASGTAEGLGELASIGNLNIMKATPVYTLKDIGKNLSKQMGIEASEEALTEVINTIADNAIMSDKSNYNMNVAAYMATGKTEETARILAKFDVAKDVLLAAAGGALSGGILGGGAMALGGMQQAYAGKNSDITNYQEFADAIDTEKDSYTNEEDYNRALELQALAQENANRLEKGENLTDLERGGFERDLYEFQRGLAQTEATQTPEVAPVQPIRNETDSTAQHDDSPEVEMQNTEEIEEYANLLGEAGKKAYVENYDGHVTMDEYRTAFNRYYDAGRHNAEIGMAERSALSAVLTNEQGIAAYKAGAQDRNTAAELTKVDERYTKGQEKEGSATDLSGRATEAQMKFTESMGKKTGLKFEIIDGTGDIGGTYNRESGTVRISVDSDNFLQTTSHELTHFIKEYARLDYEVYTDLCVNALMNSDKVSYDDLVERYERKYVETGTIKTREDIIEEIVSDATGRFLNDEEFVNQIAKENRTLAQRIVDFISDMIDSIKQLISTKGITKVADALNEQVEYYEGARTLWLDGLGNASEKYKSGYELIESGNERYQLNEFGFEEYSEHEKANWKNSDIILANNKQDIVDFINNHVHKQPYRRLYLGKIGQELSQRIEDSVGRKLEGYNVAITSEFENSHADSRAEKSRGQIPMTPEIIANIPDIIFSPDKIEDAGIYMGSPALRFEKNIDGRKVAIEIVSRKRKTLWLHTMYGWAKKEGLSTAADEKSSVRTSETTSGRALYRGLPTTSDVQASDLTSKTGSGITSNNSIGEIEHDVNVETKNRPSHNSSPKASLIWVAPVSDMSINDSHKEVNGDSGRFQLHIDEESDMDALLAENAELRKANEYLEKQLNSTKDYAPGLKDIEKIAAKLKKEYGSTYSKERLVENLQKLYNYIRNREHVDGEEVTKAATAIGRSIISKAEMKDTVMREQYRDVLKRIKNTKIEVPMENRGDFDSEGGYAEFRKKNFGKLTLVNKGTPVDTVYEELTALYPDLFSDEIINPADQMMEIARVVDSIRPTVQNPYHANMDEMAYLVGQEIFQEYFNVRSLEPTRMDKMDADVYEIRMKYHEHMNEYKVKLKAEYEADMAKARREANQKVQELRERYNNLKDINEETKEEKRKLREQMHQMREQSNLDRLAEQYKYKRRRESTEARKHKERIIKDVTQMATWLEKPTDKKHVPEALRVPLADFLKGVDFSANKPNAVGDPTSRTLSWMSLKDLFGEIVSNGGLSDKEGDFYMEVDPDIAKKMDTLKSKVQDFDKMENLELKDLRTLREVIQSMKRCVIDANYMYQNKTYERIEEVANAFQKDNRDRKDKLEYAGSVGKAMRMMQSDMLDANTMFERMGPAAHSVYQELRDGFDRKIKNTKIAQDYMVELLEANGIKEKDIREWSGKNAKVHEFDIGGKKIKFTTAQVMSLYAQNKRKQAREHIYSEVGGIKSAPTVRYDKKRKVYVIEKQNAPVKVTPYDVEVITKVLTSEQKNLADGIVKFFTTQTSEWGNEVTLRMYGYKKFMAPNYFPIVVDENYIAIKSSEIENSITTLKNMGATKSTVDKPKNPIIIEDIFDVFTRQADQMGSYNAFVIPLSDMQKFLNHKVKGEGSVKETIDRIFGPAGQDYIKQLMIDVNGTGTGTKDITSAMVRNMKAASVGANLRTVIQQPTSYFRAAAEMDFKYLAEGLTSSDDDWEMAKKYAPIVQWKEWGYFDVNTGRSMKNILLGPDSLREDLTEKSMWLTGKADEIAWKKLWEAAKAETRDLHPELKEKSEAFYEQAGKRLTEIIDKTQVVDSVLHRSKLMKSSNGLVQMYTSFMSEPTKTYNMLYRAIADYALDHSKENGKKLTRTVITWGISSAITAAAAAVIDAMRDEEDEKTLGEKYTEALTGNLIDNMNPANMVPIMRDVVSIFSGYQVQRTDMQAVQQMYYAWNKIVKYAKGESPLTIPGLMYDCSKAISLMTGVPVNNALRDLNGAVNTILGETGAVGAMYGKEKLFKAIDSKDNATRYISLAMKAYYKGDKVTGDKIIEELKAAGIEDDTIKKKYKDALKDHSLVIAAAEARLAGNYSEYDSLVDELESYGLIREYVEAAIATVGNKLDENANLQGGYGYADATRAFRTSKEEFDRVVNNLIESKRAEAEAEGKKFDEKDVIGEIKSRFTREYKEEYVKGTDAKKREIRTFLYSVRVKGKQLYSDADFKKWMKE